MSISLNDPSLLSLSDDDLEKVTYLDTNQDGLIEKADIEERFGKSICTENFDKLNSTFATKDLKGILDTTDQMRTDRNLRIQSQIHGTLQKLNRAHKITIAENGSITFSEKTRDEVSKALAHSLKVYLSREYSFMNAAIKKNISLYETEVERVTLNPAAVTEQDIAEQVYTAVVDYYKPRKRENHNYNISDTEYRDQIKNELAEPGYVKDFEEKYDLDIMTDRALTEAQVKQLDDALSEVYKKRPADVKLINKLFLDNKGTRRAGAMTDSIHLHVELYMPFGDPDEVDLGNDYAPSLSKKFNSADIHEYLTGIIAHEVGHITATANRIHEDPKAILIYQNAGMSHHPAKLQEFIAEDYRVYVLSNGKEVADLNVSKINEEGTQLIEVELGLKEQRLEYFKKLLPLEHQN